MNSTVSILWVDDEQMVCEVGCRMLSQLGYDAFSATDPRTAMELLDAMPSAFTLLITDASMPTTSGIEFTKIVRSRFPHLLVLLCTGRFLPTTETNGIPVLLKPFSLSELAGIVEMLLKRAEIHS